MNCLAYRLQLNTVFMTIEAQKSGESQLIALMQEELTRRQASNPAYSLRAFSRRIGIVPSAASEIMSGKRRISQAMAKTILEGLQINPRKMNSLLCKLARTHFKTLRSVISAQAMWTRPSYISAERS